MKIKVSLLKDYERDIKNFNKALEKLVEEADGDYWVGDFAFDLFRERNSLKKELRESKKTIKNFWRDL